MTRPQVRDDLAAMVGYHSPQIEVEVRLNTNEAPQGPPQAFDDALAEAMKTIEWHRYPDRSAWKLRCALASQFGLQPGQVFAANGSNEVLQTVLLTYAGAGRTTLSFEPTYALHQHLSRVSGAVPLIEERSEGFVLEPERAVRAVRTNRPAVTFLCSPNNPTGILEPKETIMAVLDAVTEVGGLLVVDEAYGEFAPWSAVELIDEEVPLVVAKTYSKTWAMAGARLGYLLGPSWAVDALHTVALPYHLDVFKQVAGTLALDYKNEMSARVATIVEERGRIEARLSELGAEVWPSAANFVLFRPAIAGDAVWQALVDRSVLVRNTASWERLEGCLRVTVGTREENERFLGALADILETPKAISPDQRP